MRLDAIAVVPDITATPLEQLEVVRVLLEPIISLLAPPHPRLVSDVLLVHTVQILVRLDAIAVVPDITATPLEQLEVVRVLLEPIISLLAPPHPRLVSDVLLVHTVQILVRLDAIAVVPDITATPLEQLEVVRVLLEPIISLLTPPHPRLVSDVLLVHTVQILVRLDAIAVVPDITATPLEQLEVVRVLLEPIISLLAPPHPRLVSDVLLVHTVQILVRLDAIAVVPDITATPLEQLEVVRVLLEPIISLLAPPHPRLVSDVLLVHTVHILVRLDAIAVVPDITATPLEQLEVVCVLLEPIISLLAPPHPRLVSDVLLVHTVHLASGSTSSKACIRCPVGTYGPYSGASGCNRCGPGYYCDAVGATGSSVCPAGTYNLASGSTSSKACIRCPVGTYGPYSGASGCNRCGPGYYCDAVGATGSSVCPAGTYNLASGSTSSKACIRCPVGTYGPYSGASGCNRCGPGYYCDAVGATGSSACPAGTYNLASGSTSSKACIRCPVGTYGPYSGASGCNRCGPGYYCDAVGATGSSACPAGTYNLASGSTSSKACIRCPVGTYGPYSGASGCNRCGPGYYCDAVGATGSSACPAGTYNPSSGSKSSKACIQCPVGTFGPYPGQASCSTCPIGQSCSG